VYYDVEEDTLYWHHVQAELERVSSLTDLKHLSFSNGDTVEQKSLAEYARRLVHATPSTADRIALFTSQLSCVVDGLSTLIGPSDSVTPADFFATDAPAYTSVIGYSADDRWVLIRKVVENGGLPSEVYAEIFDTQEWGSLVLPILVQPDDHEEPDELPDNPELTAVAMQAIDKIGFIRPQTLLLRHEFIFDPPDSAEGPRVVFVLGQEKFELSVVGPPEHRALVLENGRYSPPRRGTILVLPTVPIRYISNSFMGIGAAKQLVGVCELAVSPSGKRVTIGAITNLDHACWGAPNIFHWHTTADNIRKTCIEALFV
jgi:hypothetical protein